MKKMILLAYAFLALNLAYAEAPLAGQTQTSPILQNPDLKVFADLIVAADLSDLFQGTGPFTVFAPTNAAFEKLGEKKLKELRMPEKKDQLVNLLIYHIVPGKYLANMLKTKEYKSLRGKNLSVKVNGEITVNNAKVVKQDIVGPNGVIHEIDTVLID